MLSMQTMDGVSSRGETTSMIAGSGPPFAAVSRFDLWERGGGLETPPDTDAIQDNFDYPHIVYFFQYRLTHLQTS